MGVVVVTPPEPLVTRDLAKKHLRVDGAAEDTLIDLYIAAASGHIDGPGAYLGRAIGEQTLEITVAEFPACGGIWLGGSVLAIVSIQVTDADGVERDLAENEYRLVGGAVLPPINGAFPAAPGGVRVRWTAGYAETPSAIAAAVLLMVGDLYKNREFVPTVSNTVENLLRPYRVLEV